MDDEIALTREFTVDAGYAGRVARAVTKRFLLRRPTTWLELGVIAIAVLLALLGVTIMWWFAGLITLLVLLIPAALYFPSRRAFARRFPAGTVLRMGFGETRFRNDGPDFSSTVDYALYSKAERDGDFVALRQGPTRTWSYFPGTLFADQDLARFPQG
jgi:hypothetical protein